MRSLLHPSIGRWRPVEPWIPTEGHRQGSGGSSDWVGRGGWIGQNGQRAERLLQQSSGAIGQLATYPGQTGVGGQGAAQIQAGNPRPLFPTDLTPPPTTPASQQLLQISNNVDAGQQQPPRPLLQSVDSSSSFSALDVGSSPPAITSSTVTVASNSPCETSHLTVFLTCDLTSAHRAAACTVIRSPKINGPFPDILPYQGHCVTAICPTDCPMHAQCTSPDLEPRGCRMMPMCLQLRPPWGPTQTASPIRPRPSQANRPAPPQSVPQGPSPLPRLLQPPLYQLTPSMGLTLVRLRSLAWKYFGILPMA